MFRNIVKVISTLGIQSPRSSLIGGGIYLKLLMTQNFIENAPNSLVIRDKSKVPRYVCKDRFACSYFYSLLLT